MKILKAYWNFPVGLDLSEFLYKESLHLTHASLVALSSKSASKSWNSFIFDILVANVTELAGGGGWAAILSLINSISLWIFPRDLSIFHS